MPFHAFATGAAPAGRFLGPGIEARCVVGNGGVIAAEAKREGDRASPIGVWPLKRVLYRADRLPKPETALPVAALQPDDGWCDAAGDPNYNRPVKHPYPASAEKLWREDHAYDVIVILGHNDDPVVPGAGSAIFWHLAQPDWRGTEGCVAVSLETMLAALKQAKPGDSLAIMG
jgi:L,D-peptidoglycan transpeptidase YkuD (ErfK/YbiS/YcfS/YnhG family)